ncbi:MAG: ROK family protein [Parcubacteria group bacterium]
MSHSVIGIDLGGTYLKSISRPANGKKANKSDTRPSLCGEQHDNVWRNVFTAITDVYGKQPPGTLVGFATPGELNLAKGTLTSRRFGFEDDPFVERFLKEGLRVIAINDAQASALGEIHFGYGDDVSDFIVLTLGTSIGGAFVYNHRVLRSTSGMTVGIVAHLTIDPSGPRCRCGRQGCWETYCCRSAILEMAKRHNLDGCSDVEHIAIKAAEGIPAAVNVMNELADNVARGLVSLVDMMAPEAVILGGGISQAGDLFADRVRRQIYGHVREGRDIQVLVSRLGDKGAAYGASYIAELGQLP